MMTGQWQCHLLWLHCQEYVHQPNVHCASKTPWRHPNLRVATTPLYKRKRAARRSTSGRLSNTMILSRDSSPTYDPTPEMMVIQMSPKTPNSKPETPLTPVEARTRPTSIPQLSIIFDTVLASHPYTTEHPASTSASLVERAEKPANSELVFEHVENWEMPDQTRGDFLLRRHTTIVVWICFKI